MDLTGKVVVVTGGASGIGEACVRTFSELGAKVVVADRDAKRGAAVADNIVANRGEAAFVATDVTDENAIRAMVDFAVERYGGLDGAVNAAGIAETPAPVAEQTVAEGRRAAGSMWYARV